MLTTSELVAAPASCYNPAQSILQCSETVPLKIKSLRRESLICLLDAGIRKVLKIYTNSDAGLLRTSRSFRVRILPNNLANLHFGPRVDVPRS